MKDNTVNVGVAMTADVKQIDWARTGETEIAGVPPRVERFVQRVAKLAPGKYVLTLTVKEDRAFWTIQTMGRIEC